MAPGRVLGRTAPEPAAPPGPTLVPWFRDRVAWTVIAGLATFAYLPVFTDHPGRVAADTRQTMYLDASQFLSRALSMWDSAAHLGTVTHQNIGLAFPMGTYFWLGQGLGVPVWVLQRFWLGSILLAAGLGVCVLLRTLGWRGPGIVVAAVVYMGSPYVVQYSQRFSVLLLPWAALPWLVAVAHRALRAPGWRWPAVFALVVLAAGSVNATALLLVGLGPLLWVILAVGGYRLVPVRDGLVAAARMTVLSLAVSLWWMVGLAIEAAFGVDILGFTETPREVAATSSGGEILRGLGYWLGYGAERYYRNLAAPVAYQDRLWALALGTGIALAAVGLAFLLRFRFRAYFVMLVVLGMVVGVGAHPTEHGSWFGSVFLGLAENSTLGLALRSSSRAVPLVVLGVAVLLGAGVTALADRAPSWGRASAVAVVAAAIVASPAVVSGDYVDPHWNRPEDVPRYWSDAATAIDANARGTRTLELPGLQFAVYRWGETFEPITPGILSTPVVSRELQPYGSVNATDLLGALDRRVQEGVLDPESVVPIARLLSAGQVLLRSDVAYERFDSPRPRSLWRLLTGERAGLGDPVGFGPATENAPAPDTAPLLDERTLVEPAVADPPPVAVFPVAEVSGVVRTVPAAFPVVLSGDGEGVVDAAAAGLVDGRSLLLYAASLAGDADGLRRALRDGAVLVVTDTNKRTARKWRSLRNSRSYVVRAGQSTATELTTQTAFDVFPGTGSRWQTVLERGPVRVTGSPFAPQDTFEPGSRPALAFDGDARTAWKIAPYEQHFGKHVTLRSDTPITTDALTFVQAPGATVLVGSVAVRFDGGPPVRFELDESSVAAPGQRVQFAPRTFRRLDVELLSVRDTVDAAVTGRTPYGFAEIGVDGVVADEVVRVPSALLDMVGERSIDHALAFVFTRERSAPTERVRRDEERAIVRSFSVPDRRSFTLTGTVRLAANAADDVIDTVLGSAPRGAPTASSSSRLLGGVPARASAALDGDPATAWRSAFDHVQGASITVRTPEPVTFDRLDLRLLDDGRHSLPARLRIDTDDGTQIVEFDPRAVAPDGTVPVELQPVTTRSVTVTVAEIVPVEFRDAFTLAPKPQPVAIAELGIPGVRVPAPAALLDECRDDLVTIDGRPLPVRLRGSTADLLAGDAIPLRLCDGAVELAPGRHVLRTAVGLDAGVDVDRVVLTSAPGGRAAALDARGDPEVPRPEPVPPARLVSGGATSRRVVVPGSDDAVWLVLAESLNRGWRARQLGGGDGGTGALGRSTLVNGFANGWYLGRAPGARAVQLTWTPQRWQTMALAVSGLAVLGCLVMALSLLRRGRRLRPETRGRVVLAGVDPPLPTGPALAAGGVVAVVGMLLVPPAVGLVLGVVAFLAARARHGRVALAVTALALGGSGLAVVLAKRHFDPGRAFDAFARLPAAHWLTMSAIVVLAADLVIGAIRTRAGRPAGERESS